MSENLAYGVQFGLFGLVALGAALAFWIYVKTSAEHGGFVALILGVIAISMGADIWDSAQAVLQ